MQFEFGKYTEITEVAHKIDPNYLKEGYTRLFICPDTWDTWLARILINTNGDYEHEEGCFVLERDKIQNDHKGQSLRLSRVREILENDDRSNWDFESSHDLDELIEMIDGGFGIHNLKEKEVTE